MEKDEFIKQQLLFQNLLISLSTKYINADLSEIDELVRTSLRQIGEFVMADRSYIFSYNFVNNTARNLYESCAKGIMPEIEISQNIPIHFISDFLDIHKNGEAVYVEDVRLLPNDGEFSLRAIVEPRGIKSFINIPMIKNNELVGFIGFSSIKKVRKYSENEKNILFVFANMLVNVMQRKDNEELLKEQEQKKEELLKYLSVQNEELNEYAHVVSHDLKVPLINIHTLISWYIDDYKEFLGDNQLNILKDVLFNVEKMDFLIKGILAYSSKNESESVNTQVDLNLMIDEVLKTILVPLNIKIIVQKNLPTLYGNALKFKQVFQNLIENAIKYSNKKQGIIKVGVTEKNEFFVKDNGKGIKPDYFESIFDIYTKLGSMSCLSGIGLSIVKKIIRSYKGTIWVESKVGIGTTFFFTILKDKQGTK